MSYKMIYLVRHGQALHNETGDYSRHIDPPLTQSGQEQARALRDNEALMCPDIVISSPLRRALETAHLAFPDSHVEVDFLCKERRAHMCDRLESEIDAPDESTRELLRRAKTFIDKLRTLDGKIVIISHGKFMSAVVNVLAGHCYLKNTVRYANTEIVELTLSSDPMTPMV